MRTNATNIVLSYKYILYMEVACTNCFASSLNTYIDKTPVSSFGVLFAYLSADKKPYYNSSLFLNESIDLISIGL